MACQEGVEDDAEGPDVRGEAVRGLLVEDLAVMGWWVVSFVVEGVGISVGSEGVGSAGGGGRMCLSMPVLSYTRTHVRADVAWLAPPLLVPDQGRAAVLGLGDAGGHACC